jgi:hypothetical protein
VATDSNGMTATSGTISFFVYPPPTLGIPGPNRTRADVGQQVTFSVNVTGRGSGADVVRWDWTGSPGLSCVASMTTALECTVTAPGSYMVLATVTDRDGGTSTTSSSTVTVFADPTLGLASITPGLTDVGLSVDGSVTASGGYGGFTYQWNGLPGNCERTLASFSCSPDATGTYDVTVVVSDADGFAVSSRVMMLTVNPALAVGAITGPAGTAETGQNLTFSLQGLGGSPPIQYAWAFGDGATGHGPSVSHSYARAGSYVLWVWVNDSAGGSVSRELYLTVASAHPAVFPPLGSGGPVEYVLLGGIVAAVVAAVVIARRFHRRGGPGA